MKRAFSLAMLNGPLDDGTLLPFLDALPRSGYEGVCFHPRDGMLVPYGSRYFWERLEQLIEEAQKRDLAVWYYDEFPYPSGMFGGMVAQQSPSARVRSLDFAEIDPTAGPGGQVDVGPGALLALLRYECAGQGKINWTDVTEDCGAHFDTWVWGPWHNKFYTGTYGVHEEPHERGWADRATMTYLPREPLKPNERLLAVKIVAVLGQKGLPGHPDVTLPEVTDRFLQSAYAPLAAISARLGMKDTPVFQDEVSFGTIFPWNRLISSRLQQLWGPKWRLNLPAIFERTVEGWENVRYQYRGVCAALLEENWFARVAAYCHNNGLLMTGHLPGEESIVAHTVYMGNAFKSLRHFDIPGYDIISYHLPDGKNCGQGLGAKVVQSVAWLEGGKPTMVEAFGSNGFQLDLQASRGVLAWLALHGLDQVFDHSTYTCALGPRKYDAPPINTRFNPLDKGRALLWDWHRWFCEKLEQYSFSPRTLVLFPVESLCRFSPHEWEEWREQAGLVETWYHTLFTHSLDAVLIPAHRLEGVKTVPQGFEFNGTVFKRFVVPPVPSFHADTARQLQKLSDHPGYVAHAASEAGYELFGARQGEEPAPPAFTRVVSESELLASGPAVFGELLPATFGASTQWPLQSTRYNADGGVLTVVQNPYEVPVLVHASLWPGRPCVWADHSAQSPLVSKSGVWEITLVPGEVALFERSPGEVAPADVGVEHVLVEPGQSQWRNVGANHLCLLAGTMTWNGGEPLSFVPGPVSHHWKLEVPYNEASSAAFGTPYSLATLPEPGNFEARFEVEIAGEVAAMGLVWDDDSLPPGSEIYWGGERLSRETRDVYDHGNGYYNIPFALLGPGKHRLRLTASVKEAHQGILEPPRLTGHFKVDQLDPLVLKESSGHWAPWEPGTKWHTLGMPHGYGPVEYRFLYHVPVATIEAALSLALPSLVGVAQVEVNGHPVGTSCWEPRQVQIPPGLCTSQTEVIVRVFGSWNNLFSQLNHQENGLSGLPTILMASPQ